MRTFTNLLKTELKLNIRNMNMVIFAVIMPVVVLVVLGIIYQSRPAYPGAEYTFLEQSMSAVCTISIGAGGLMGLPIVVSEYRERKILKRFQVTPVSPVMLLVVEFTIYVLYALVSMVLLFLAAACFWGVAFRGSWPAFIGSWFLTLISTLSIGMMVGGISPNSQTASVIASLLYFPMLIFSGATLPYEVMPSALQKVADILPLTQGIKLLKAASLGLPIENVFVPIIVMVVLAAICIGVSLRFFKWE